jgi:hypothetical protein
MLSRLAAALVVLALSQGAPAGRIAPGPVTLRITSSADGKPLPGVVVRLGGRYAATGAAGDLVLDGVPPGAYTILIEEFGYNRFEKTVELPAGKRDPIPLTLTPITQAPFKGIVRAEGSPRPVPGARIVLHPTDVISAIKGRFNFTTHWDGTFSVHEVPTGRYRADVSAAGCHAKSFDVEIKKGMSGLDFALARDVRPADLAVTVQNSVTGAAVPGASVELAEAWPKGKISEGRTDAAGRVAFKDLLVGRLNAMDDKDRVTVARRQATVRVEAAGFEPALALVTLDARSAATVAVNPVDKVMEAEPNNALAAAQTVRTGAPIEFRLPQADDRDFFRFRLKFPARLKITVGPKNPCELWGRLLSSEGKLLREAGCYKDNPFALDYGAAAGEYFFHVEEWGMNGFAEAPLTLRIDAETTADPLEPNDTASSARLLQSGEEARGTIMPVGDVDFLRFEVKRPGWLRFTMPKMGLERWIIIRNEGGAIAAQGGCYANHPLEVVTSLAAGWHTAEVHEWGDNDMSTEPYTLRMEYGADDGIDDPPDGPRLAAVRLLEPNSLGGSSINPIGDMDRYSIPLPGAGEIHVRYVGPTELWVRLRSAEGKLLAESGAYAHQPGQLFWPAPGPAVVFLEVREWGDNDWSSFPYILRTVWKPCDENEAMGRNDTPKATTPVDPHDPLRGSIMPLGDVDGYAVTLDRPGFLEVEGTGPTELCVRIFDPKMTRLTEAFSYAAQPLRAGTDVPAGTIFLEVREWGDNASSVSPYALKLNYRRVEPDNGRPLTLKLDEARSFAISRIGEKDVFFADIPDARKFFVRFKSSSELYPRVFDDRTGQKLAEFGVYANSSGQVPLETKGPTRLRIEVEEWGNNDRAYEPSYVLVGTRDIVVEKFAVQVDPFDVTRAVFTGTAEIDADGDGKTDFRAPGEFRYRNEGLFAATALHGAAVTRFWVDVTGPRERKGVHLIVDHPAEGQVVERDEPCRVRAIDYSGRRVQSVALAVDGRPFGAAYQQPFEFAVPWRALAGGDHELSFTVGDRTVKRTVRVSNFFDLQPEDNATLSGRDVRVSWSARAFGPARVRYRLKGTADWKEAVGQNAKDPVVVLTDLEAGKPWEFQPGDGPVRTVTRVKGLAFGRSRYSATIARDYDQKVGISVRNHAEKPMTVRLECGKPDNPDMLAGFVGEGSEGAPFPLAPGEEREFWLGISAQDVNRPLCRFPVRITSDAGLSDEAEVEVGVKQPVVKLEWQKIEGPGLEQKFRLINRGDALTDLSVTGDHADFIVTPSIRHGLFPAGSTLEITAAPRLYEGFRAVEGKITAKSVDKEVSQEVKIALKEGERIFGVQLTPGGKDSEEADLLTARAMAGAHLSPAYLAKKTWGDPQDTNDDGKIDRWTIDDAHEGILWVGDDGDGDGEVDFVHADIGSDGQYDYSAFRTKTGWDETNLVEAWLEMGFKLPWARTAYEKHDLDVVMNGRVVASLRGVIPEGNYSFKLPPDVITFNEAGTPDATRIEIQSKHLRGGHYVVNSDFRIKLRLTGTRVWVVAGSEEEAVRSALKTGGLSMEGADYSVSSADLRQDGDFIVSTVRNIGATRAKRVAVALFRGPVELRRTYADHVPLSGGIPVRLPWKPVPGTHTLRIVLDPDQEIVDTNRDNNEAMLTVSAPGTDARPTVKLEASVEGTVLSFSAEAVDDHGLSKTEVRIDNGLWRLMEGNRGKALVQPGEHTVTVRVTDGSGQQAEDSKRVRVEGEPPKVEIAEAIPDEKSATLKVNAAAEAVLVVARVNGGPWTREMTVPLPFGKGKVEVMAAAKTGAIKIVSRDFTCTKQPEPGEDRGVDPARGVLDIEGLGSIDLFGSDPYVFPAKAGGVAQPMAGGMDGGGPAGGFVGVQQKQSDYYCTNRPNIKVGFQLPDWLKRLNLPKPGTKEYEAMVKKLLAHLKARGYDTSKLEKFQEALLRRIGRMEGPDELPGFLESLGLAGPKPKDPKELEAWRASMQEKAQAWWLRLLASGDPKLIAEGLRARAEALGKFDEASQLAAEAVIETVNANQKITEDVLSALPLVGDAMDILSIVTGETLSGEKMTALSYVLSTVGVLGPAALEKLLETKAGREAFEAIAEKAGELTGAAKKRLCDALSLSEKKLDDTLKAIGDTLTKERRLTGKNMDESAETALKTFKNSPEGAADLKRVKADQDQAQALIKKLEDAKTPDEVRDAVMAIQRDKTAQGMMNAGQTPQSARDAFNKQIKEVYDKTDDAVKAELKQSKEVQDLLKKHNLKPEDVDIDAPPLTGNDPTKIGRDRDVTYQIRKKDGTVVSDIHHDVSKQVYDKHFYAQSKGLKEPPANLTPKQAADYADEMDQAVTSKWHPEAYNTGQVPFNDFIKKGQTPTITRVEDLKDTMTFKSDHWFHKAKEAGNTIEASKHAAEGMRQATKQYDRFIMPRVKQYAGDLPLPIPPRLQKGMEIFKRVESGEITVKQAEAMLDALSHKTPSGVKIPVTKESIVQDMGSFLEHMEKKQGAAFRKVRTADLQQSLGRVPNPGTGDWAKNSIQQINDALKAGHVDGPTFMRMRDEVKRGLVGGAAPKEGLRNTVTEMLSGGMISPQEADQLMAAIK